MIVQQLRVMPQGMQGQRPFLDKNLIDGIQRIVVCRHGRQRRHQRVNGRLLCYRRGQSALARHLLAKRNFPRTVGQLTFFCPGVTQLGENVRK